MANKNIFIVEVKTWWNLKKEDPYAKRDLYVFDDLKKADDFIWELCSGGYYTEYDPNLDPGQGIPVQRFGITSIENNQHWLVDVFERQII